MMDAPQSYPTTLTLTKKDVADLLSDHGFVLGKLGAKRGQQLIAEHDAATGLWEFRIATAKECRTVLAEVMIDMPRL